MNNEKEATTQWNQNNKDEVMICFIKRVCQSKSIK